MWNEKCYDNGTLIDVIVIGIIQPKGISTIPTDGNDRKYFKKYEGKYKINVVKD